ncbi:MAG TPA: RagB/SusD family nutrient uptake outer membrane protein [Flavisolibacter sp.]|nr:RagB/SusD family nutrient uptake outer membrane protein [Flavisolibacter sp.]
MLSIKKLPFLFIAFFSLSSCSKLDEKLNGQLTEDEARRILGTSTGGAVDATALLRNIYNGINEPYSNVNSMWALQQHTSDETMGPTRGGDWDDGGVWRVLHSHKWDADHPYMSNVFRNILRTSFSVTDLLRFNPPAQQAAEARFLRAFTNFTILDGWDQVPYRERTEDPAEIPKVRKGSEALDYIIKEVTEALPGLPDVGPAHQATKNAARVLLMKAYLQRGVIKNRANPTFDKPDMDQVIALADQIIASNRYSLTPNFFDNFAPTNDQLSTELIFTLANRNPNVPGTNGTNGVQFIYHSGLHYNSPNPMGGWNGFTTLSDFYDKFSPADRRREASYPGLTDVTGLKVGFLIGQQFGPNGVALKDRKGNPLAFRREVKLLETDPVAIEVNGIRVVKYVPDLAEQFPTRHDWVFYRYADVLLMRAEALVRSNRAAEALTNVNTVRARAGLTPLTSVTLDNLLDERGRELYWEGHRRTDLIRFGKFLQAWQEKGASDPSRLLFPIPNRSLAANPNLVQNPGY